MKFCVCKKCKSMVAFVKDSGVPVACCGEPMEELVANTADAAREKHVPVISVDGSHVKVDVSSVEHPMADVHYIEWVALETKQGNQRKELAPGQKPVVQFEMCEDDEVVSAYAYCNLHGLWKGTL